MTYRDLERRLKALERKCCCADEVRTYDTFAGFPAEGIVDNIYLDKSTGDLYYWDGDSYENAGGSGVESPLNLEEIATPAGNPDTGYNYLYFKTDGLLYKKDDAGVETAFTPSQWITNGSDIYFSAGTVGIGTSTEYTNNSHDAQVSVLGHTHVKAQYESVFENTRTTGFGADATQYNVLAIKTNHASSAAGIRFLDINGLETGAFGYANPGTLAGFLDDAMYITGSNLYNASGTATTNEPRRIVIGQEGVISAVQTNVRRMMFDEDWSITMFNKSGVAAFKITDVGVFEFGDPTSGIYYDYNPTSAANAFRAIGKEQGFQLWKDGAAAKVWSLGNNSIGAGVGNDFVLNMYNGAAWSERLRLKDNGVLNLSANARQSFADDASAGAGGLAAGDLYQVTGTGVMMVKQ